MPFRAYDRTHGIIIARRIGGALLAMAIGTASAISAPTVAQTVAGPSEQTAGPRPASSDGLDRVLAQGGLKREDLGWAPEGWWLRYPRAAMHKLDFVDGLFREPFAAIPFVREMARSAREYAAVDGSPARPSPPGKGPTYISGQLVELAAGAVNIRYSGIRAYAPAKELPEATLDDAILDIYREAHEPTRFQTFMIDQPTPDIESDIRQRAAQLSPEVSRILGRLLLQIVSANRSAQLAFRKVSIEQRLKVSRELSENSAQFVSEGLDYANVVDFDDVSASWDEGSLWDASLTCVEALDEARRALQALPASKLGTGSFAWRSPLGWIRIYGTGSDTIELPSDTLLAIDLGGNDTWRGTVGASSATQTISLALDLSGDDQYIGEARTQGAGVTGIGILMDTAGNDRYQAGNYAQGVGQLGFGALFDLDGTDTYKAGQSGQGSAPFVGVGMLADVAGNDRYYVLGDGQGYGGPGGVGMLVDRKGDDVYEAPADAKSSGRSSYGTDRSASAVQGFGAGRNYGQTRAHSWAGGLGALIDLEGNDTYRAGSWAQGAGIWFGTGVLYDGAGNDDYFGDDRTVQAAAAHEAIGLLVDEGGDDKYRSGNWAMGAAHDFSIAILLDGGGNDRFTLSHDRVNAGKTFGMGASSSFRAIAALINVGGDDIYAAPPDSEILGFSSFGQSMVANPDATSAAPGVLGMGFFTYPTSTAIFLDIGGQDRYPGKGADNTSWGEQPGTQNWSIRNVGEGLDLPAGTIDWRPRITRLARDR